LTTIPAARLAAARIIVASKIDSQRQAARHYQRHGCHSAGAALRALDLACDLSRAAANIDALRGVEGAATAAWFNLFAELLSPPWHFPGRARRPPTDPVNALLSLGYTILQSRVVARCQAAGLEVYLGALHEYRAGRPSLACDLMEPLRVPSVDRWVLRLCHGGSLRPADFTDTTDGTRLQPAVFPGTIHDWEEHWVSGGHDTALDQNLEQYVRWLRGTVSGML
jgi:CRISPR-associated protein Cas1